MSGFLVVWLSGFLVVCLSVSYDGTFLFKRKVWLRRFIVEQATARIKALRDEVKIWEEIYGESFNSFQHKIETDEAFARKLDETHPLWEGDFINWKFYAEELQEWLEWIHTNLRTGLQE